MLSVCTSPCTVAMSCRTVQMPGSETACCPTHTHARIRGVELACCCPWRAHSRVPVRRRTAAPPRPSELRHSGRRGCGRGRRCRADADRDAPGHRHRPGIRPAAGQAQIRRGDADRRGADPGPAARHQPLRRHYGRRPCGCRRSRHLMRPANTRGGGRQAGRVFERGCCRLRARCGFCRRVGSGSGHGAAGGCCSDRRIRLGLGR